MSLPSQPLSEPMIATAGPQPFLDVHDLSVAYPANPRDFVAFKGVRFDLHPGETLGIVGESGSGKSTLALTIAGLLHLTGGYVREGRLTLDGMDIQTASEEELRAIRGRKVGMIFQQPLSSLNPVQTIGWQIEEGMVLHSRMSRAEARDKAADLLRKMLLPDARRLLDRYPHELSGGMRQRIVIAIALANDPGLIIADEPTTALDVTVQAQVLELLRAQIASRRLACLFISHDIDVVGAIADRVGVMYGGRLVEKGPTADVLKRPYHPYTRGLILSAPRWVKKQGSTQILAGNLSIDPAWNGCRFANRCPFAVDQCAIEPPLEEVESGRDVACWRWQELAAMPLDLVETSAEIEHLQEPRQELLSAGNLSKTYQTAGGTLKAVDDASFVIHRGESVGVVGESGSGKSTLARLATRLIEPSRGTVRLNGEDFLALSGKALRRQRARAQMVFQNPTGALDPRRTIYESLASPLRVQMKLTRPEERARIDELLQHVALSPVVLSRYPHQLSGGQKQRVSIARALATGPDLLICDEPLSALDVTTQAHVMTVLMDLRKTFDLSMLYISHDLATVRALCDTVLVMYLGRIVESGRMERVLGSPRHPYTQALVAAAEPGHRNAVSLEGTTADLNPIKAQAGGCRFRFRCPKAEAICHREDPAMRGDADQFAACHFAFP